MGTSDTEPAAPAIVVYDGPTTADPYGVGGEFGPLKDWRPGDPVPAGADAAALAKPATQLDGLAGANAAEPSPAEGLTADQPSLVERVSNLEGRAALTEDLDGMRAELAEQRNQIRILRAYIVDVEKELRRCQSWVGHQPSQESPE